MTALPSPTLRHGLAVLPLGQDVVVFSEEAQCILGLNPPAAAVFRELQEGTPLRQIGQKLASISKTPEEAEHWVSTTLEALGSHGLLAKTDAPAAALAGPTIPEDRWSAERIATMPPYEPFAPIAERRYGLLGTCALIRYAHKGQLRLVEAVIGHLALEDTSRPTVVIDLKATKVDRYLRSDVYRDGEPVAYASRLSMIGPVVKSVLWQSAVNAHDFLFYIHAGVVGTDKGCVLLPAQAGSGKSSLTAALIHRGFRYFSDEVALIQRSDFKVPPMPLAICVKNTGWDVMAKYYPDIMALTMHWRDDGKRVIYIPPPQTANWAPAPVSHIVFPRYEEHARTAIHPISQSDALGRLMVECLALRQRLDYGVVRKLVSWMGGISCYTLTFSSLDEAIDAVTEITGTDFG
jgi:hypothetical protein